MNRILKIITAICLGLVITTPVFATDGSLQTDLIFKNHGSAMLMLEVKTGKIIDANQAAIDFYGYSKDEIMSMTIQQMNTSTPEEVEKEREAAALQERNYFVFRHKLKDGSLRDVEVYSYPFVGEKGDQFLFSIIHDITPRINAEKEVRQGRWIIISLLALGVLLLTTYVTIIRKTKKELMKSNQQLKSLFDNMQEGFSLHEIICDDSGKPIDYKFIDANHSFEEMTGLNIAEIRNRTIKEVLPNTEDYWIEKYGSVALSGSSANFSNYSRELNKHFSVSVYSPKIGQFATIFADITDQVLANDRVALEKKLLVTILEDTLSGYWDWDLENGTEYLSPSFKSMFGYEDHELESSPETWQRLIFEEDLPCVMDLFNQHVESQGRIPFYNEVRYHHKNGSTVWVICSGRVVEWSQDNKALRMVGCHIDITRMKQLEKVLREEKALFKTTLQSLGDGVISTDKNGKVDIMNVVAEKLTGWSNEEARGKDFDDVFKIINEVTREGCESPVKRVFESREIIELDEDTLLIKKNGEELPIEDSAAPIRDEKGNISGAVVVFRDYTDKKEKQDKIAYLSYHDQLTGLYNRRFFEEELKRLDTERNLPFTIAMLDVNGLKLTNDAFGHLLGDALLKKVAEILRNECRTDDIIARIGGDEFVILLPKTTHEETDKIVRRIYEAADRERIENIIISVSIGWETKQSMDQQMKDVFIKAEEHMYTRKLTESQSMRNRTMQVILQRLNETNERERIHSEKVCRFSKQIGIAMKLGHETIKEIEIASLMHDIGKIAINEKLLNKPAPLTKAEFDEIKKHPETGYQILKAVDAYSSLAEYVLAHHERWDGTGYPRGLQGEDIPLIARIIMVAEAYEAMTSDRPYRNGLTKELAIEELRKHSGTQFDPEITKIFIEQIDADGFDSV